jgi:hypothetical protein
MFQLCYAFLRSVALIFAGRVQDNNISGYASVPPELKLAAVDSRSSMVGALLRSANPSRQRLVLDFLQGLSRDELECLAEFQGSCVLEEEFSVACQPYRLMADFFDPSVSERWRNPDDRAHKMFVVLAFLDILHDTAPVHFESPSLHNA